MKKFISLIFILVLSISLISCGTETKETIIAEQKVSDSTIKVDENIETVEITIPEVLFDGQDMSTFDIDTYAQENKFNKAVVNADGSVTVTMTKARHKEVIKEMQLSTEESYQKLVGNTDTPYIESIDYDKGFKTITVKVDRTGYDASVIDRTSYLVGIQANLYQTFTGEELHAEVIKKYSDNGDVISSVIFPDIFQYEEAVE